MRIKLSPRLIPAVLFVVAVFPVYSQSGPSATQKTLPLSVGVGLSDYATDYGPGTLLGGTLWIDYIPYGLPQVLHGLGVEIEGRDLNWKHVSPEPPNLRLDVAQAGVIYSWRRHEKFRPYGKFLAGLGNIDYEASPTSRHHDTRTVTTFGGGVDYHLARKIWARGDFEYQNWPDFWKNSTPGSSLNPYGITVGVSYDFGSAHAR